MSYLSVDYVVFAALLLLVYYLFSVIRGGRFQWVVLLLGSMFFYYTWAKTWPAKKITLLLFLIPAASGWLGALLLEKKKDRKPLRKLIFLASFFLIVTPLVFMKIRGFFPAFGRLSLQSVVMPLGMSFYTLQLIAYLTDCYKGKIRAQRNPLKHLLFVTFFPQIIQGPIPRYGELGSQLFDRHSFAYENLSKGMLRIVWGFFLKLMIADKAAVFVNAVFDASGQPAGGCVLVAAVLYALQLYADFYSCTSLSLGVAQLFGIQLSENFSRPYLALSVSGFWRRWHISLSSWLKDYVYIPLGGSRKGSVRKYINILVVFLVSGLWHGSGLQFLVWGGLHAVYQIAGSMTLPVRERIRKAIRMPETSPVRTLLSRLGVFFWVTVAWVFFRADSVRMGVRMIRDAFSAPWTFGAPGLFSLGLDVREFLLLLLSVIILLFVSLRQEKGVIIPDWFARQHLVLRWSLLFLAIVIVWIFGTYGYGFNAQDFIYGGF